MDAETTDMCSASLESELLGQAGSLPPPSKDDSPGDAAKVVTNRAGTRPIDLEASLSILQQATSQARQDGLAVRQQATAHGLALLLPGVIVCAECGVWAVGNCPTCQPKAER